MPFSFKRLFIPDLILIEPKIFKDIRGFFMESYKYSDFKNFGILDEFQQDNLSRSYKGVIRGLHFQKEPRSQGKLIQCLKGSIFDVAVDIRIGSPTFGRWASVELSDENRLMFYIPPGFAHGFAVISDYADVLYRCTREYSPQDERGIIWNDPDIKIEWPLKDPILSEKDSRLPILKDADINFYY